MPLAPISNELSFYYEDSGPLDGPYTTLVMVHGTAFHAGIFRHMLPLAPPNGVRIVLLNRRDYPETTPFSPDELEALGSADLVIRAKALGQQGLDVGHFLAWFVRTQSVPPVSGRFGGIALVAWSLAHTPLAGLLAFADQLPEDVRSVLGTYLRAYCIYDAPHGAFGLPTLSSYHPLTDPTHPEPARVPRFFSWVSTYYTHPPAALDTHDPQLLDTSPLAYPPLPTDRPATLDNMAPADIQGVSWPGPIAGSEGHIYGMPLEVTWEQTRRMLFDKDAGSVLPGCKVVVAWGENTLWEAVGAAWAVEKIYKERKEAGEAARTLKVVEMMDANHFPHWDCPEMMIQFLRSVV
ncbi:hypothetical protein FA95DRAFT_1546320 [Auriscalpium vulgare]|uniref:Uncharacterized protein n=1 Tax=Auriscalpium vulgare TaxID=40419 RepID=A0ACB8RIR4_9AGAM|nr:hypothetical protein FA95DRAFT_1546320 [Auriscalpium vulgare]